MRWNTKRRHGKEQLASEYKQMASGTQEQIDQLKSENPFESAGAKAAMAKASRGAKEMQTRMLNTMGAGASPEAMIGLQGVANEALGSAAGEIATGAEANKLNRISNLENRVDNQMSTYGNIRMSGFEDIGKRREKTGQGLGVAGQIIGGAAKVAKAIWSDKRLKENIKKIGELQGCNIYKFNYKGETEINIGVIAQDIEDNHSDCIVQVGEYMEVDYDKLFKEV